MDALIVETGLRQMKFIVQELDGTGWHTIAAFGTETDARIFSDALATPQWRTTHDGSDKRIMGLV